MSFTAVSLSPDQERAVAAFIASEAREFTLAGLAGTGKTTVLRNVIERLAEAKRSWIALAPTAKACRVLASKGVGARTIHSTIYDFGGFADKPPAPDTTPGAVEMLWDTKKKTAADETVVIVDEASMVDARMADDIRARAKRILWVGDHGQLPPIGEDPHILSRPDVVLEKIHRQAADSPILRMAYAVRLGRPLVESAYETGIEVACFKSVDELAALARDRLAQVTIVARNDLRNRYNRAWRQITMVVNADDEPLELGEKMIGLRNCHQREVWNGEEYKVDEIHDTTEEDVFRNVVRLDLAGADGELLSDVPCWIPAIGEGISTLQREASAIPRDVAIVDYAYARTCHKAQGSEWDSVVLVDDELPKTDMARWRYTAVTRAREKLVIGAWA